MKNNLNLILYKLRPRLFQNDETPKQRVEAVENTAQEIQALITSAIPKKSTGITDDFARPPYQEGYKDGLVSGRDKAIDQIQANLKDIL